MRYLGLPKMTSVKVVVLLALSAFGLTVAQDDFLYGQFPDGFIWGAATAAYQIEGGWNADGKDAVLSKYFIIIFSLLKGKGENIWDYMTHFYDGGVLDNSTGDVAADSYNKYQDDITCLKETGVRIYPNPIRLICETQFGVR